VKEPSRNPHIYPPNVLPYLFISHAFRHFGLSVYHYQNGVIGPPVRRYRLLDRSTTGGVSRVPNGLRAAKVISSTFSSVLHLRP